MMNELDFPPSAYGYRSIRPRTRSERLASKDKVALEKHRLDNRVGWVARMHQANAPATSDMLTSCQPGAAGYISNEDRFHTDTAGDELKLRQQAYQKQLDAAEFKRRNNLKRDEDRWKEMEEKTKAEEEHYQKLREDGRKAIKNQSKVAYDITTLQYHQDVAGEHQKYCDDMVRYRAQVRTNDLVTKGDSRVPYNIISGNERPPLKQPQIIPKPDNFGLDPRIAARVNSRRTG